MRKLIAAKTVTTKGERRGTMYFPGGGAAGRPVAAKAGKQKARRKAVRPRWAKKSA